MIKQVGHTAIQARHRATCHCGAVELEIALPEWLSPPRQCNCSICRRKGALMSSVPLDALRVVKGEDQLKLYTFHSNTAQHYFCGNCGIYTHHRLRSNPSLYGFNVGCLEGVNPFLITDVSLSDGINHPSDRAKE